MDLRVWVLCLAVAFAQVSLLIETHELATWIRENRTFCLLEVIGLGDTSDPRLDSHIPRAKTMLLKDILDQATLPGVKSPKTAAFIGEMKRYEVTKDTIAVLYDRKGMRSAAMLWWVMNLYGRSEKTAVLNGGLPKWIREGFPLQVGISPTQTNPTLQSNALYLYSPDPKKLWTSADIDSMQTTVQPFVQVLDVRARSDYVQSSIKSSVNMPIDIIHRADGALRSTIELKSIFEGYQVVTANTYLTVVVSVNGVDASAAILALGVIGKGNCALLDGGWNEYLIWVQGKNAAPLSPPIIVQPVPAASPGSIKAAAKQCTNCDKDNTQTLLALSAISSAPVTLQNCWEHCVSFCQDLPCEERCMQSFCQEAPTSVLLAEVLVGLSVMMGVALCCAVIISAQGNSLLDK